MNKIRKIHKQSKRVPFIISIMTSFGVKPFFSFIICLFPRRLTLCENTDVDLSFVKSQKGI